MKRIILFAILLNMAAFALFGQNSYATICDIPYHEGVSEYASARCRLDLYYPEGKKDFATVVWFHGGGMTGGNKYIPEQLKECGLAVVAVNYRLMPNVQDINDVIDDAAAAIAWTFSNIGTYGGSTGRIFVAGHSAGAYLIDMTVLNKAFLAKYGVDADSIAGAFPFSAQVITHFNVRKGQGLTALQPTIDSTAPLANMRVLGMPMFILSGDRELEMNGRYEEQAYFWRMMKLVGNEQVYLYEFDGFTHGNMPEAGMQVMKKQIRTICAGKPITR